MSDDILRHWGDFGPAESDDPYPLYATLRDEAPVHQVTLPGPAGTPPGGRSPADGTVNVEVTAVMPEPEVA